MATDIKAIGDQIAGLTLMEAKQLADYLKEAHGIEAAAGAVVVAGGAAAGAAAEEKTEFDVILVECGAQKMGVLMDPYVIDVPWPLRRLIVSLILIRRPAASAEVYRSIWWDEGSSLLVLIR